MVLVLTGVLFGRIIRDRLLIDRFEQTEQLLSVRARSFESALQTPEWGCRVTVTVDPAETLPVNTVDLCIMLSNALVRQKETKKKPRQNWRGFV